MVVYNGSNREDVAMDPAATVPVTVDAEAAELVTELGMHAELERMLEHIRQSVTGLTRIKVVYADPYDTGPDPSVVIEAYRDTATNAADSEAGNAFNRWQVRAFSPDLFRHFVLLLMDEIPNHAR
jgi:hypothetical protein